ncbi:hypothetical protein [Streptococcus macacae]|uniref:Metallo-beta-lactamase domain protein n=1 Tax=Streptococcus macacae NCTC 11558 TaxID=764298 RepID=G5JWF6_9STRE|nr:hypothetical protein [Streptococcus macacae]EHJ51639.1 hypothetical protein STRMA_1902 [Streptococcus macacae NCTC 11558]SUN77809.1 Uncharacterised protein [Streptococcus macacae NCTC 11558]
MLSCDASRAFPANLGITGEVISTPGHSEDSVSLVLDSGEAVVGDLYPIAQVPLYDNPVLTETWQNLPAHHLETICYAHSLSDDISSTLSFK